MIEWMHDRMPFRRQGIHQSSKSLPRYDLFASIFRLSLAYHFALNTVHELHCRRPSILHDCPVDGRNAGSLCITNWDAGDANYDHQEQNVTRVCLPRMFPQYALSFICTTHVSPPAFSMPTSIILVSLPSCH